MTSGLRFHPIETARSMACKQAMVAALGAPAVAVLTCKVPLYASSLFTHANVRLPTGVDRVQRQRLDFSHNFGDQH